MTTRTLPIRSAALRIQLLAWGGFLGIWLFRFVLNLVSTPRQLVSLLPDDAYYYYLVGANIAGGVGSTFDGVNPTNGYHPLWMMIVTAMHWVWGTVSAGPPELILHTRVMLSFQMVLGLLAVVLAWAVVRRACGGESPVPALVPAAATMPWVLYGMTDGLESGLTLLFFAALLFLLPRLRPFGSPPGSADFTFGALLSIGFLARLDLALLCLALALVTVAAMVAGRFPQRKDGGRRSWLQFLVKSFLWALPVLVAASVYFGLNRIYFDTMTPISGKIKSTFPALSWNGQWLAQFPVPFLLGLLLVVAVPAVLVRRLPDVDQRLLWLVLAGMILLQMLHTLLFMHWAVHSWHFTAWWIPGIVAAPLFLQFLMPAKFHQRIAMGLVGAALVVGLAGQWAFLMGRTERAFQARSHEAGLWAREHIAPGRLIGMSDCGVFAAFRGGAVVNLDGVINNLAYQDALAAEGLAAYLDAMNVDFIAHHAIPVERVAPGYGAYVYSRRSHLHRVSGGSITLSEEDELFRSPPFHDGRGEMVFVLWRYQPERRYRPEGS